MPVDTPALPGNGGSVRASLREWRWEAAIIACLILGWLHVWLRVEPSLRYGYSSPGFLYGQNFFQRFVSYPGGILEYAGAFLAQGECSDLLGATLAAVLAGLLFWAARGLLRPFAGRAASCTALGLPLLLFLMQDFYDASTLGTALGLVLALGLAWAAFCPSCRSWRHQGGWARWARLLAICWSGAGLLFWLAGFWLSLVFAVLCSFLSTGQGPGTAPAIKTHPGLGWLVHPGFGCLGGGLAIPLLLWRCVFPELPFLTLVAAPVRGYLLTASAVLCWYVPAALGLLAAGSWLRPLPDSSRPPGAAVLSRWDERLQTEKYRFGFAWSLMLLAWVLTWTALDNNRRVSLQINRCADHEQWAKTVALGSNHKRLLLSARLNLLRALFHSGRLPESMFSFSVPADLEQILDVNQSGCFRAQSQTLLELGHLNLADRFAFESLECEGDQPETLELLARINALRGYREAARVFLRALRRVPFHRADADRALACLDTAVPGLDEKESAEIRSRAVKTDQAGSRVPVESLLHQLLHSNPRNRMASEYLMAQYLLTFQVDRFVSQLGSLAKLGYQGLPRHYEEALLLWQAQPDASPVPTGDWAIRPETRRRFREFTERAARRESQTRAGLESLRRDFGDTYWYYNFAAESKSQPASIARAHP